LSVGSHQLSLQTANWAADLLTDNS